MISALRATAVAAAVLLAPAAFAALPFGSLSFVEPTGTVGPTDVIDVRLRFTLGMESTPLLLAPGDLSGFQPEDLPTEGEFYNPLTQQYEARPFAQLTDASLNVWFSCSDTFTNNCNGTPRVYTYNWHYNGTPDRPSAIGMNTLSLQPGDSFEYVFVTFTPRAGGAPAGHYAFYGSGLSLSFNGVDDDGNFLYTNGVDLGFTCSNGQNPDCAFTRTVVAVPEPQTWLMLGLGLAALAPLARRRRA